jgi:hypothetical protein
MHVVSFRFETLCVSLESTSAARTSCDGVSIVLEPGPVDQSSLYNIDHFLTARAWHGCFLKRSARNRSGSVRLFQVQLRRAVIASTIGTAIEWYDFFLYSTVTGLVFAKLFFPNSDPWVGTAASRSAAGFDFRCAGKPLCLAPLSRSPWPESARLSRSWALRAAPFALTGAHVGAERAE